MSVHDFTIQKQIPFSPPPDLVVEFTLLSFLGEELPTITVTKNKNNVTAEEAANARSYKKMLGQIHGKQVVK